MSPCPPADLLAAFAAGELSADEAQGVAEHMSGCTACADVVAHVAPLGETAGAGDTVPVGSLGPGDRLDRYQVLSVLGKGAFGVVYAAYDPKLDRRVAIKVLRRPEPEQEARLLREAQVMARLSSPHVVSVHDTGRAAGGVYVAMDFVEGRTLSVWLQERKRSPAEIVAAFAQAGRGLAAAHAAGVIHRDFKPDNVMVHRDGRVAVTDFGLARQGIVDETPSPSPSPPPPAGSPDLTARGVLVGTPLYMAPEIFRRGTVDARSDLFSFCVALYAALYGSHPYPVGELTMLMSAVERGPAPPPSGGGVARHVRDAVLAGLAPRPEDRPASMNALLRLLEHDPRAWRRGAIAAAGALALAGAVGFLAPRGRALPTPCRGGEHKLELVWDAGGRGAARRGLLASGSPYGAATATTVERVLDRYASSWVAGWTDACEATQVRGEQSAALLDQRMACLEVRRGRLASLARTLAVADRTTVEKAPAAAYALPPVDSCADPRLLSAAAPLQRPEHGPLLALARSSVSGGWNLRELGRYRDALDAIGPALAVARATGDATLDAETHLLLGVLQTNLEPAAAEATFHQAAIAASAAGRADLEARARIQLVTAVEKRTDEAMRYAAYARALVGRLGDRLLEADLLRVTAYAYLDSGQPAPALAFVPVLITLIRQARGPDTPQEAAAYGVLGQALYTLGLYEECAAVTRKWLALNERILPPDHPVTLKSRASLGLVLQLTGSYDEALVMQRSALEANQRVLGPDAPVLGDIYGNLSRLYGVMGRDAEALDAAQRALAIKERAQGPDDPDLIWGLMPLADALATLGRHDEAVAAAARAVDLARRKLAPDHELLRRALGKQVIVLADAHRCAETAPLERPVLDLFDRYAPTSINLANILTALAECRLEQHRPAAAVPLLLRALAVDRDGQWSPERRAALATAYAASGRRADAEEAARAAVAGLGKGPDTTDLALARYRVAQLLPRSDAAAARGLAERALAGADPPLKVAIATWLRGH